MEKVIGPTIEKIKQHFLTTKTASYTKKEAAEGRITVHPKLVVACSGGLDSTVLLDSLSRYFPEATLLVAHVNYRLRQESDGDAAFVRSLCACRGVAFFEKVVDLSGEESGVEDKARKIRYDFFESIREEQAADAILLAQHRDDQVETVLLQMIRGGFYQQKAGMALIREHYLRPFLTLSKADLRYYAEKRGLAWREDRTNQDATYTGRNRLRQDVLPALRTINQRADEHLLQVADQLEKNDALLRRLAEKHQLLFEADFTKVDRELWPFCLRLLAESAGLYEVGDQQLRGMLHLMDSPQKSQGKVDLKHDFVARRSYHQIRISKNALEKKKSDEKFVNDRQQAGSLVLELDQWYFLDDLAFQVQGSPRQSSGLNRLFLPADVALPLRVERAKAADKIPLKKGRKSLRRLLIDEKIPAEERSKTYLLKDREKNVLAVFLGQKSWYYTGNWPKGRPSGKQCLVWRIEEN
ncbi:tRNA lysidine(34) synthetase TilS [Fructobacillus sp. M1-13]|uniref:tRNA(Ile)-lysidine synthase n=1 Tax=Fructobacillus papyriferae TaxID=2713171 RepID=A0ABS5QQX6_9LACO|nr:tRNA lysidine(34) synthetase TilS [Fructobacillus papyriferae]MBS9335598.1 tRNA lysidine(34) synthetase TilS [Fructobacillus papyriferae]MCD2159313.1 tRNA lysidine(34) synthetase TilS [Fructobacillus papyriferae]